jgi:glycosyltransferase involved in cell wall biosynthesis
VIGDERARVTGQAGHEQPDSTELERVPRVVFVIDSLANNGAVQITLSLVRRWAKRGAVLAVLQRVDGVPLASVGAEVPVRHLTRRASRLRAGLPPAVASLVHAARAADVVVGGSEIGPGLIVGYLAARITRRPFVVSVHADLDQALGEWMPARLHPLLYRIHRRVDGAVCVAPALVEPLVRNGLPADRISVVRNGIDTAAVRAQAAGEGNLVEGPLPVVVATGRLAPQKGYDLLLRAHAQVVQQYPHRVLIVNDGPELSALQALAGELGVSGSVQFAGAVPAPLPSVAKADLFCLPSRHEGLPLALLEAVALGVPTLAADCAPGVRDALDGGRVGRLIPPDDVAALAQALADHLRDPADLKARAALGPDHARSFDSAVMARGWAAALRKALR